MFGLTNLINCPTRYGATKNSCIDQIVTNSNYIQYEGLADITISDHQFEQGPFNQKYHLKGDLTEIIITKFLKMI